MLIKFTLVDTPPGKLADAEMHFSDPPLDGLKLIGFGVWERRGGGGRSITFPARSYAVNGERRTFALLRPIRDTGSRDALCDYILRAYDRYTEAETAAAAVEAIAVGTPDLTAAQLTASETPIGEALRGRDPRRTGRARPR